MFCLTFFIFYLTFQKINLYLSNFNLIILRHMKKIIFLLVLLTSSISLISCNDDDDIMMPEMTPNIVETAQSVSDLSSLVSALIQADAGLVDLLQTSGPFTVFAPTNQAFTDLLNSLGNDYNSLSDFDTSEEKALLVDILTYHVVSGTAAYSSDLSNGQMIETAQGESITINLSGGVFIDDATEINAQVTSADVEASNGVVHIINKILLPQSVIDALTPDPNIVALALDSPILSNLVAALQAADGDLVSVLNGEGPFTVLAPTNDAFANFLSDNGFTSLAEVPTDILSQVLLNHVISGTIMSSDLISAGSGYASTNASGAGDNPMSIYYNTSNGVTFNNISSVITPDVEATNGVVHIVDAVIGLPSIVDHALANANFSNLVASLGAADGNLVDVLVGDGPFTVLAPDDNAFATFLSDNGFSGLGDVPTDALSQVLLNHVISGVTLSTDLVNASSGYSNTNATGPGGNAMSIYFNTSSGVTFNGVSNVTLADVVATNGIIHAVDAVIGLPTIVTFAAADPNFSTLVEALTTLTPATDFISVLSTSDGTDPAPFTVFAPTNAAFSALPSIPEEAALTDILLHHVISNVNVTSSDLTPDGDTTAQTMQGDDITITLPGTNGNIADVTDGSNNTDIGIIAVDVQASNGVIHVLNKVLINQ